ncbi:MAG: IS4 family transposase [Burkholderiales bacterium]
MITLEYEASPAQWARNHFAGAEMSDLRRVERVITIAEAMAISPGESLPQMYARPYDLKAAYNFFAHPEATPELIQAGHRELVALEMRQPGAYLCLEDTTEPSWPERDAIPGLGPVGGSKDRQIGFLLHSTLVVRAWEDETENTARRGAVEILGFAAQQYHVRQPAPPGETRTQRQQRARESQLWLRSTAALGAAPADPAVHWRRVCDRGADIFESLVAYQDNGHEFTIRATQDRALVEPVSGRTCGYLFATVRAQEAFPQVLELLLRARPGQPARTARLSLSAVLVHLRSPKAEWAHQEVLAVRVWEEAPPEGVEPLEWILLCSPEPPSFAAAQKNCRYYAARWFIEEFHKALKTGLKVEELQLETGARLMAATAVMSVVALRLLDLREAARLTPDAPAEESHLSAVELEVLAAATQRELKTVREVTLALGRLGGHLNRKRDGLPGWQTLWRGWQRLQAMVVGFQLAHKLNKFG